MGKFSNAGRTGGRSTAMERLAAKAQVELPVEPQEDVTTSPAAYKPTAYDPSVNLETVEELPSQFNPQMNPEEQLMATLEEQQRQSVPDMRTRFKNPATPAAIQLTLPSEVDGGIFDRANRMAEAAATGELVPPVDLRNTTAEGTSFKAALAGESGMEIAERIREEKMGSVQAAIASLNAVDYTDARNPIIDPDFMKTGSLVTENMLMEIAGGASMETDVAEVDPIAAAQEEEQLIRSEGKGIRQIAKQQANSTIGQQIALEYQRLKGNEVPTKIPRKEAETLGDAFKMMWVSQNPNLAKIIRDPATNQKFIELTPEGDAVVKRGAADRARLFPKPNVRPAKNPLPTGQLPGDIGENVAKVTQGPVGKQQFGKEIEQAVRNLGLVPNVVDPQRMRIIYSTALPVLKTGNFETVSAHVNNIGREKYLSYVAKHGEAEAEVEMQKAQYKLAQEIQSIAMERKGANYLSYAKQGFQGRLTPQQRFFNPTTSKAVRFVTRNAVAAPAKPGSRVANNLEQMYAMMLVPGASSVLPHVRKQKFDAYSGTLEKYGERLERALQMTDDEAEAISQAIEKGIPLTDPSFPKIKPLALDPNTDADLIGIIKSKGEDGMHYIDGVIDASKYIKAKRAGKTHYSYFNAYIDGKTNGIASNGIQMGISKTARQTGVMRYGKNDYLDEGDIRDALKNDLLRAVDDTGFTGVDSFIVEMNAVARAVYSHRDLNKKTTMTFGYGKEIPTFWVDMVETVDLLLANPDLIKDDILRQEFVRAAPIVQQNLPDVDGQAKGQRLGETLMTLYQPALEGVMSAEALSSRNVMRSASVLFAATNNLMAISGPTGMDLHFGRGMLDESLAEDTAYNLRGSSIDQGKKQFYARHQGEELTSAAPRMYDSGPVYGDYAWGGSVVGPVQALDAAAVAKLMSGRRYQRLKSASGGNPYVHTIYDAFKSDAMSYDVILEEVNTGWLDAAMDWSYLEETAKSLQDMMTKWQADIRKRDPKSFVSENEAAFLRYIMQPKISNKGNQYPANYMKRIGTAGELAKRSGREDAAIQAGFQLVGEMRKVGYDWNNPPENVTVAQLVTFVTHLGKVLNTNNRLKSMIETTNNNKRQLRKEILENGYEIRPGKKIPLQYYEH